MHLKMRLCEPGYKTHKVCLFIDDHNYLLRPCFAYSTLIGHAFLINLNPLAGNNEFLKLQACGPVKRGLIEKSRPIPMVATFTIKFKV